MVECWGRMIGESGEKWEEGFIGKAKRVEFQEGGHSWWQILYEEF